MITDRQLVNAEMTANFLKSRAPSAEKAAAIVLLVIKQKKNSNKSC